MSYQSEQPQTSTQSGLKVGNVLPSFVEQVPASSLYVSISELIMEKVFFHPGFAAAESELDQVEKEAIQALLGEQNVEQFFVTTLVDAITSSITPEHTTICVELNDATSYEMSALLGGKVEVDEVNPQLGLRGVSRFSSESYQACFALECEVIKALRAEGHNIEIVVPCVRALSDAAKIIDRLAERGLPRGLNGLKVLYACDTPSAVLLSERLLHYFDGLVLKLESLTQLTLGVDLMHEELAHLYDPQNEAVLALVKQALAACHQVNKPASIVVDNLSDLPQLVELLQDENKVTVFPVSE
ncbi:putative PEP-binding protein [Vibrio sp. 10N]|uniref:putative PEP-binding protein n=1 Tax=Vibrio sp. 10N TaxID=3058938 RepID=UPI0028140F91|nr:phosphoenolpyruvate synthase [Vibrio sp. 10N]